MDEKTLYDECVQRYETYNGVIEVFRSGVTCVTANNGRKMLTVGNLNHSRRVLHDISRHPDESKPNGKRKK